MSEGAILRQNSAACSDLYVFVGPNGSGKSTLYKVYAGLIPDRFLSINADLIASSLTDGSYEERNLKAAKIAAQLRESYLRRGMSFSIETVGSREDKLDFLGKAKAAGYIIHIVFVTTCSPEINKERVRMRVSMGGHDVPDDKIVSRYMRTMTLLPRYVEVADEFVAYDNSRPNPVLVFSKRNGKSMILKDPTLIPWVRELYNKYPKSRRKLENPEHISIYSAYGQ